MRQDEWAKEMVKVIGASVAHYRRQRRPKMSAQALADACKDRGYPGLTRSVIANFETGARDSISVPEWLVLAAALEVAPLLLLFPVGRVAEIEALPDLSTTPMDAVQWAETGYLVGSQPDAPEVRPADRRGALTIADFREHGQLISRWQMLGGRRMAAQKSSDSEADGERIAAIDAERRTVAVALDAVRDRIRSLGLTPPDLRVRDVDELRLQLSREPAGEEAP